MATGPGGEGAAVLNFSPSATTRDIAAKARLKAAFVVCNGHERDLRRFCTDGHLTGVRIIFTRDDGMHSSGWWKNPQYARCYHLSLSFREPISGRPRDPERGEVARWVAAIFSAEQRKLLWFEPVTTKDGRVAGVVGHWRLFCNEAWEPHLPHGEVYSKRWTPKGWKSWSDVVAEKERA